MSSKTRVVTALAMGAVLSQMAIIWYFTHTRSVGIPPVRVDQSRPPSGDDVVPPGKASMIQTRIEAIGKESVDELFSNLDDDWPIRLPAVHTETSLHDEMAITLANRRVLRLRQVLSRHDDGEERRSCLQCMAAHQRTWKKYHDFCDSQLKRFEDADDPAAVTAEGQADPVVVKAPVYKTLFLVAHCCGAAAVAERIRIIESAEQKFRDRINSNEAFPESVRDLFPANVSPQPAVLLSILSYAVENDASLDRSARTRYFARLRELTDAGSVTVSSRIAVPWDQYPAWFDRPGHALDAADPLTPDSVEVAVYRPVVSGSGQGKWEIVRELAQLITPEVEE